MNALSELERLLIDYELRHNKLPERVTMSPRKWYEFLGSLPGRSGHDVYASGEFLGVKIVKGLAPGLTCRMCGAEHEPGRDDCAYCKAPKHVIEVT